MKNTHRLMNIPVISEVELKQIQNYFIPLNKTGV